jgi:hypothetical protein
MELTDLELEFLQQLMKQPGIDHRLVARLVEVGYARSEALPTTSAVHYEITAAGRDAIS